MLETQLFQSLLAFIVKLGAGLTSYALFAVTARMVGAKEFGAFSILFSAAMLLGTVGSFGQQVFLVKEIPKSRAVGDKAAEFGAYSFAFVVVTVGASTSALLLVMISPLLADEANRHMLISGAGLSFLFASSQATIGALRVQGRTLFGIATRDLLWRLLSLLGIVLLGWWLEGQGTLASSAAAMLVLTGALFPIVLLHWWLIIRHLRSELSHRRRIWHLRDWLGASAGFALIAVLSAADTYVYTIGLGILAPADEAGVFFAAMKTVELLTLFFMAVTLIIGPRLSLLMAQGDKAELQRQCNTAILLQGVPALIAGAVLFIAAPLFLSMFNATYTAWSNVLRLLIVGSLVNALSGATGLLLQLAGLHWRQVLYQGGSLILSIALLPLLVPAIGIMGAAIACVISRVLWNTLAVITIRGRFGVDPSLFGFLSPLGGGLAAAIAELRYQLRPPFLARNK